MTWIGAIDQGTTSTRFVVYDMARGGSVVAAARRPVALASRQPGWAEQDPEELVRSVIECLGDVDAELQRTTGRSLAASVGAIGLTNQRETTVAWDAATGRALSPAICMRPAAAALTAV